MRFRSDMKLPNIAKIYNKGNFLGFVPIESLVNVSSEHRPLRVKIFLTCTYNFFDDYGEGYAKFRKFFAFLVKNVNAEIFSL